LFKFIHTADIHLDSPLQKLERYEGAPVQELRQATRRAFENMVQLAISEAAAFVLIAGDIYDGDWKDYNTGLYFVSQMSRLRDADIPVLMIAGNHDAANKITKSLRLPESVHVLPVDTPGTVRVDTHGVAVHGQGFPKPAVYKDLSVAYPSPVPGYFNIGLLHSGLNGREGHEPYAPCTLAALVAKQYDYWALGHVHQCEILHQDPLVVFPGNIQGRHIRESGAKGCMLVTVDSRGRPSANFRTLDVIRWASIQIDGSPAASGYELVDLTLRKLEALLKENTGVPLIVRIEITGASRACEEVVSDVEHWTNEIRSAVIDLNGRIWIEKLKFRLVQSIHCERDKLSALGAESPVGEIISLLDELHCEPTQLKTVGASLDDLVRRLPREIKTGSDAIVPENIGWLKDRLEEVKSMLLRRLLSEKDVP
jgi:DNA repair exonuclease SbcCD nuclease subunit